MNKGEFKKQIYRKHRDWTEDPPQEYYMNLMFNHEIIEMLDEAKTEFPHKDVEFHPETLESLMSVIENMEAWFQKWFGDKQ